MADAALNKNDIDRIGRSFALLFNRATMYRYDHPHAVQSTADFHRCMTSVLRRQSPIVLLFSRDQFFVEDEPLDGRLNTARMGSHFEKAKVQSISFEAGLSLQEVEAFLRIFTDLGGHPDADAMKAALAKSGAAHVRINHVFFRKMTEDDAVVSKERLGSESAGDAAAAPADPPRDGIAEMVAGQLLVEEAERALSIRRILENPAAASRALIQSGGAATAEEEPAIVRNLGRIRGEVEAAAAGMGETSLAELAEAVFDLKRKLFNGIDIQKAGGAAFEGEARIREEADSLTDAVFIRLVRQEYRKGEVSVPRLAQICRRLIPDPSELQRLLPDMRTALLEEGMTPEDFLAFGEALKKELQSEGLARVLQQSAEAFGVDGDAVVREAMSHPQMAAEMIYLASEIRKREGDEEVLTGLLVEYVERLGCGLSAEEEDPSEDGGESRLREVMGRVQAEIVDRLRTKGMDRGLLASVEERLKSRIEEVASRLQADRSGTSPGAGAGPAAGRSGVLGILGAGAEEDDALRQVLEQVRSSLRGRGADEGDYPAVLEELARVKAAWQKRREKKALPLGALNRSSMLYFLEKEIARASRYGSAFSAVMLAVIRATPGRPVEPGVIGQEEIRKAVLERMAAIVRNTDFVGTLGGGKLMVVLPMIQPNESRMARRRIVGVFHGEPLQVQGVPVAIKLASSVTDFHPRQTPTLKAFIRRAESGLQEMASRLRHIQDLM